MRLPLKARSALQKSKLRISSLQLITAIVPNNRQSDGNSCDVNWILSVSRICIATIGGGAIALSLKFGGVATCLPPLGPITLGVNAGDLFSLCIDAKSVTQISLFLLACGGLNRGHFQTQFHNCVVTRARSLQADKSLHHRHKESLGFFVVFLKCI